MRGSERQMAFPEPGRERTETRQRKGDGRTNQWAEALYWGIYIHHSTLVQRVFIIQLRFAAGEWYYQMDIFQKYLLLYFWPRWVFPAVHRLSLAVSSGCSLLRSTGCRRAGFNICSAGAQLLCSTWYLPGPGIEPMSPALAGRFFTTEPPGKPYAFLFLSISVGKIFCSFCKAKLTPLF